MSFLQEVHLTSHPMHRFAPLLGPERMAEIEELANRTRKLLEGRVVWNVNSTAAGGGVAEMLRSLLGYTRGLGIDARWIVIRGTPEFFHVTKRLHHALHGARGDGSALGDEAHTIYEEVMHRNAVELGSLVRPDDVVLLHDPQTAGLVPAMRRAGARVIWRCHIGTDRRSEEVERGWAFLLPYLEEAHAIVLSRASFRPPEIAPERCRIIPPSIDAFSAKNQDLAPEVVRAILVHTGIVEGPEHGVAPVFVREDGAPGRVDRRADVIRLGRPPSWQTPLVVQVSRWDPLKDPIGVMQGFASLIEGAAPRGAELVLAGPSVTGVADDPEQGEVWESVLEAWHALPHAARDRIHLVCLPMADIEENAAIVNAIQRHAAVVVQKSLEEGFGLTVTEAMWKARPVVASAVGGILEQIEPGVHGLLLKDPRDLDAFADAVRRLLVDRALARRLGRNARERVRERFLGATHLVAYAQLIREIYE